MLLKISLTILILSFQFLFSATAQKKVVDTLGQKALSDPQKYDDFIDVKTITRNGLFKVHQKKGRYYFEIPDSLMNTDILIVNRITKGAAIWKSENGYAGDLVSNSMIQFIKGPNNKIFIKKIDHPEEISNDSSDNGMYRSVVNSNLQPLVASFDIKAFSRDSSAVVIDVTNFINTDNSLLFFDEKTKAQFNLSDFQTDKSFTNKIQSFPLNIEISTTTTYSTTGKSFITFELNSSIVLLPRTPMLGRRYDPRVGYFPVEFRDFDADPQGVEDIYKITKWRLEPNPEDMVRYERGELVTPQKPIVFYIDPATPKKWVPFLIAGVNDWQKAFEKAGFKNAIYALEAPKNDTGWSIEDARHNVIVYKPSAIKNASGPHIHDPRSGEILETHVSWYHNVMALLHDWYMIQAGAIDPRARKMEFDEELMGQLIRFVSSHEIGHTLGLMHNFGSSSTVSVDSLRSKSWVEVNGHTPSIMDYARFNYVAQPEDSISEKGIFPRIGVYDEWAIEWGYRLLPRLMNQEKEKEYLDKWIIQKLNSDHRLWYGPQGAYGDPRSQSEDLGDNAMKASYYGIQNLKRIVPQLPTWTKQPAESNSAALERMYSWAAVSQFKRYLLHVAANICGVMWTYNTEGKKIYDPVPRYRQKEAVNFLQNQIFTTPTWFVNGDKQIYSLAGGSGLLGLANIQKDILTSIMDPFNFDRLLWYETNRPDEAYTVDALLYDLEAGIWKELNTHKPIDIYRRNLQKVYASRLIDLLYPENSKVEVDKMTGMNNINTDIPSVIRDHIKDLVINISNSIPFIKDKLSEAHLQDVKMRLKNALEPEFRRYNPSSLKRSPLSSTVENEYLKDLDY